MDQLLRLDLQSPFVAVTVDSARINAVLEAIVQQMGTLSQSITRIDGVADQHADSLRGLTAGAEKHSQRLAGLEGAVGSLRDVESRMATVERNVEGRLNAVSAEVRTATKRVDVCESKLSDVERVMQESNARMEKVMAEANALAEKAKRAAAETEAKLEAMREAARLADQRAQEASQQAQVIAATFDLDLAQARGMLERSGRSIGGGGGSTATTAGTGTAGGDSAASAATSVAVGSAPTGISSPVATSGGGSGGLAGNVMVDSVAFCRALPSFQSLEAALRRFAMEEAANVRALLDEKLDAKIFYKAEAKLNQAVSQIANNEAAIQRVSKDVESRVPRSVFKSEIEKLQNGKADRAELVGMVTHEDIRVLNDAMAEVRAHVERTLAGAQLEAREERARNHAKEFVAGSGAAASAAETADIMDRVKELERQAKDLYKVKADKADLDTIRAFVENSFANFSARRSRPTSARAATPPDELSQTPRRRLLSPISRPPSASITEVAAPAEPLYYTSLPVRPNSPERSRHQEGAATNVFDANGYRTSALLSHSKPVPAAEHFDNMRRVAAGETVVPDGYVVHDVGDFDRPRSALSEHH